MRRRPPLPLLLIALTVLVSPARAQNADSILDDIARSLADTAAGWN